ncbi:MAG: lipid-A-disaccharide synthase [bacterium]|nr:lipid-A-disaccharide synthase [bacterium]MCP4799055.1 lipid-A-disaccharide synthase [bacterium]
MSTNSSKQLHVLISCGELSGEKYAAELLTNLKQQIPNIKISALCGDLLVSHGANRIVDYHEISVMGFSAVIQSLPQILQARSQIKKFISDNEIDLFIPVDFPGFNGSLAKHARKNGIPVYSVVAPQLWAWGAWRVGALRKSVDRLLALLPFEKKFFADKNIPVVHLGHPLVDVYDSELLHGIRKNREFNLKQKAELKIGFLPGSRKQEIKLLLPMFIDICEQIKAMNPDCKHEFEISCAADYLIPLFESLPDYLRISQQPINEFISNLDYAVVCSGTASLEVALAGLGHSITYKTSPFNYWLGSKLVRSEYIGLTNLVMDKKIVAEFVQDEARADVVVDEFTNWMQDSAKRSKFDSDIDQLHNKLGVPRFWQRVANDIVQFLGDVEVL